MFKDACIAKVIEFWIFSSLKIQWESKIKILGKLGVCSWYRYETLNELGAPKWFHNFQTYDVKVIEFWIFFSSRIDKY
jgi:hypothetical protein